MQPSNILVTQSSLFQVMIIKDDTKKKVAPGKEAAIEADVRAAIERAVVPLETTNCLALTRPIYELEKCSLFVNRSEISQEID